MVIITMQNYLATLGAWVTVIQGAIFVAGAACLLAAGLVITLRKPAPAPQPARA